MRVSKKKNTKIFRKTRSLPYDKKSRIQPVENTGISFGAFREYLEIITVPSPVIIFVEADRYLRKTTGTIKGKEESGKTV
jgi:hypothetical protein